MHSYYLHTDNAQLALTAITKGLSSVRLSTDLNITEQDYEIANQELVLDEDNRFTVAELKKIVKKKQRNLFV